MRAGWLADIEIVVDRWILGKIDKGEVTRRWNARRDSEKAGLTHADDDQLPGCCARGDKRIGGDQIEEVESVLDERVRTIHTMAYSCSISPMCSRSSQL